MLERGQGDGGFEQFHALSVGERMMVFMCRADEGIT
jgi:hypothetical protein